MLSSKNDTVWPSYESAVYMENKLNEVNFPYEHKHVAYENISHALLATLPLSCKLAFKSERRKSKKCAEDREQMKAELLNWVYKVW